MDFKWILNEPYKANKKIISFCETNKNIESYYKIIRNIPNKENIKIITTNYTPLSSIVSEIDDTNIAYLNGNLNWFECPYELKVYDVLNEKVSNNKQLLFPYIFIQSGTKPIVEKRQLNEFIKAINFLEEINKLVIVGYRINCDDNHVNSLIRSFIIDDNKTVEYLDFDSEEKSNIIKRLRLPENSAGLKITQINNNNNNAYDQFLKSVTN